MLTLVLILAVAAVVVMVLLVRRPRTARPRYPAGGTQSEEQPGDVRRPPKDTLGNQE